jgi:tRNA modification GTPase
LLYLFDLTTSTPAEIQAEIEALNPGGQIPTLVVGNKRDLASEAQLAAFRALPATILIAAGRGDGLADLQTALLERARGSGLDQTGTSTIVTNLRHARSLEKTNAALDAVLVGLATGAGTELVAADLRQALAALGEITGEISSDDLLTSIFTQFCIGK